MDHRAFLAGLSREDQAALTKRSDRAGLVHLAGHVLLIVALATPVAAGWPGWWLALPLLGVALAFLFTLEHECTHQTPFASAGLNEAVGRVAGFVIFQPFLWFRYFHLAHHRYTNDPQRDPELAAPKPGNWRALLWYLASLGYWRSKLLLHWRNAFGVIDAPYLPPSTHARLRREARVSLLLYLVAGLFTLFVSDILIRVWLLPLALGFPVLRLYLLAEHGGCPAVADMFRNTRTTYTTRVVRFLAWNMPYHAEHHAHPSVPFHRLPALHALAAPHLRVTENGYGRFARRYVAGMGASR